EPPAVAQRGGHGLRLLQDLENLPRALVAAEGDAQVGTGDRSAPRAPRGSRAADAGRRAPAGRRPPQPMAERATALDPDRRRYVTARPVFAPERVVPESLHLLGESVGRRAARWPRRFARGALAAAPGGGLRRPPRGLEGCLNVYARSGKRLTFGLLRL